MTIENLLEKWYPILNHWDALPNRSDENKKYLAIELEYVANYPMSDHLKIVFLCALARGKNV